MPRNSSHTRNYNQQQFDELQQTINRMTRVRSHRKKKRSQSRHGSNSSLLSLSQSSLNDGYSSRSQKESSQQAPLSQRLSQFLERIASPAPVARRDRSRAVTDLVSRSAVRPTVNARPSQFDRSEYYSQASQASCDSPTYSARSQSHQPRYAQPMRGNDLDELEILTQPAPDRNRYQAAPTTHNAMPTRITQGNRQAQDSFMLPNDNSRGRQQLHTNATGSVRSSNSTVLESPRPLRDMMLDKPQDIQNFPDSPGSASVADMSAHMDNQRQGQGGRMNSSSSSFAPSSSRSVSDVRAQAASTAYFDSNSNFNARSSNRNVAGNHSSTNGLFQPTSPAFSVCMSEINMRHVQGNQPQRGPSVHPAPASTTSHRSVSLFGNSTVVPTSAPPKQKPQITKPHASTSTLLASASRISANSRHPSTPAAGGISRTVPLFGVSAKHSPQNAGTSASSNLLSASSRLMEAKSANNPTSSVTRSSVSEKSGTNNITGDSQDRENDDDDDNEDDLPETCATQEAEALLPSPEKKRDVPRPPVGQIRSGVDREALAKELESLKESLVSGLAKMFAKLQEELKSELKTEVASSVKSHVENLAETEKSLGAKVTNAEKSMVTKCTQIERSFTEKLGESQGVLLAKVAESVSERVDSLGNRIEILKRDVADVVASQSSQLQSALSAHTARCVEELSMLGDNSTRQISILKRSVHALSERVEELKHEPPVVRHQISHSTQTLSIASPPRAKTSPKGCQTTPEPTTRSVSQCVQTDTDAAQPRRLFLLGTPPKPKRLFILAEPRTQSSAVQPPQVASNASTRVRKPTRTRCNSKSAAKKPTKLVTVSTRSRRRVTARPSTLDSLPSAKKAKVNPPAKRAPPKRRVLTRKKRVVTAKSTRKQQSAAFSCENDSASETDTSVVSPPAKRAKTTAQEVSIKPSVRPTDTNTASKATGKRSIPKAPTNCGTRTTKLPALDTPATPCADPAVRAATNRAARKTTLPALDLPATPDTDVHVKASRGARKKRFSALNPPATPESDVSNQSPTSKDSPEFTPMDPKPTDEKAKKSPRAPPSNVWKGRRGRVTAPKLAISSKRFQSSSKKSPDPKRHLEFDSDDAGNKSDDASDTECSEMRVPTSQNSEQAYLSLIQEMRRGKPVPPPKYRVRRKCQQVAPKLSRPHLFAAAMEDSDSDASAHDPYAAPAFTDTLSSKRGAKRMRKTRTTFFFAKTSDASRVGPQRSRRAPASCTLRPKPVSTATKQVNPSENSRKTREISTEALPAAQEPSTGRRSRRAAKPPARSFMVSF